MADQPVVSGEKPTEPVASSAAPAVPAVPASAPPEVKADPSPSIEAGKHKPAPPAKPAEPTPPVEPVKEPPAPTPQEAEAARVAADAALAAVPEKYEIPGVKDTGLIDAITPVLKDAKVSLGQAQKLAAAVREYNTRALNARVAADLDALRADPALGQLNFGRTQQRVNDALAAFSTPEERSVLTSLGIANNPALVRMFHRIGTAMQEAPETPAGSRPHGAKSTAGKLYGGGDLKDSGVPARNN